MSAMAISSCIDKVINANAIQTEIDEIHQKMCTVYYNEMNANFKGYCIHPSRKSHKRKTTLKPFWNDILQNLWNNVRISEKIFLMQSKVPLCELITLLPYVLRSHYLIKLSENINVSTTKNYKFRLNDAILITRSIFGIF